MKSCFIINLLLLFVVIAMPSCKTSNHNFPQAGASSFDLSETEVAELKTRAEKGGAGAAIRLYRFYDFVKLDHKLALYWLKKAAELDDASAQYILGKLFLDDDSIRDTTKAYMWLNRAKENGSKEAAEALMQAAKQGATK